VVSNPVASSQIDTASLNGTTATQTRRGDGTFDTFLSRAIAQLDLAIMPLTFEFDFSSEKTEEPAPQPKEDKTIKDTDSLHMPHAEVRNEKVAIQETKIIKQALMQNLPPLMNLPISINLTSGSSQALTKQDMQLMIDELVKQARIFKLSRRLELNLDIESQELGKLLLSFHSKDGAVAIEIFAANAESRKLLDDHVLELESALKDARITLDSVRITEVLRNGDQPGTAS
jgi:flagellar hook-length control protein FliK